MPLHSNRHSVGWNDCCGTRDAACSPLPEFTAAVDASPFAPALELDAFGASSAGGGGGGAGGADRGGGGRLVALQSMCLPCVADQTSPVICTPGAAANARALDLAIAKDVASSEPMHCRGCVTRTRRHLRRTHGQSSHSHATSHTRHRRRFVDPPLLTFWHGMTNDMA